MEREQSKKLHTSSSRRRLGEWSGWSDKRVTLPPTVDEVIEFTRGAWTHGQVHKLSTITSGAHSL